ncbi:MAG: amino acid adenylation domain-containing protein [Candidatus Aminicenantes bacterium]|nr:MAG: amino acid adenylation domain-containing protein [Candidatus Aminicenantes bacterium]
MHRQIDEIDEILLLTDSKFIKQREYWLKQLSGDIVETEILLDYNKNLPPTNRENKKKVEMLIPELLTGRLMKLSKKSDISLYIILLTVLKSLIYRYTENEDIIVLSPPYGAQIGEKVKNCLLIRNQINERMTFKELLLEVKQSTLEAYRNQDYPFERLLKYLLSIQKIKNHGSLSQVVCQLKNIHETGISESINSKLDFSFLREEEKVKGIIRYDPHWYEKDSIEQISRHFLKILEISILDVNKKIAEISFLTKQEKERLIVDFNRTEADYPKDKPLQRLFAEQVEKTPDKTALVYDDKELSYKALDCRANQLARLLGKKGVGSGDIVAIMAVPSLEMVPGILGILKAGAAYLPVDPDYPEARVSYILEDSQIQIFLNQNHQLENMKWAGDLLRIEEPATESDDGNGSNLDNASHANDLAYIIYTSGSTGNPKGVMIEHASVVNLALAQKEEFGINERERVLQFSSLSFDASVEQIFISLFSGSVLVLVAKAVLLDNQQFEKFLLDYSITHIHAVPSFLNIIGMNPSYRLKRMVAGGDVCPPRLAHKWHKICHFYNEYGPTETTVTSIELRVKTVDENWSQLPIGKPLPNTTVFILDQRMRLVPRGATGELYIGGAGVARGYLNNPELTGDKFLNNPFVKGERMYHTGDLARWLPDGNIEFLGRIDYQVKIRGFRIELEEIEHKLINYKKNTNIINPFNRDLSKTKNKTETIYCTECLLSSHYPDIHFNQEGICSVCQEYEEYEEQAIKYFERMDAFHRLIDNAKRTSRGDYDCMLLFSGGKDSSYVLYQLVEMGLNVLAFTFDNGYISDIAFENIERITSALHVDSMVCKAERMNEIFVESLHQDDTVCTGCFKALTTISTRIAMEKGINVIITGLSRGQIFDTKLHGLFQQHIFDKEEIEEKLLIFREIYHSTNDPISKLLNIELNNEVFKQIYFVDFFRYNDTPVHEIKEYLKSKDIRWNQPGDTGFCSTNCIINDVGIYVHLRNKGYHNYSAPLSWDCRLGQGTRQEALKEIEFEADLSKVQRILKEIGYLDEPIKDAVVIDKEDESGDKYLCAYLVSDREIDLSGLKDDLSRELPEYMVPAFFIQLDKMPLTPTGKLDRQALPEPGDRIGTGKKYEAPGNEVEEKLVEIWSEVLAVEKDNIGINDNFFELGGHSLKATILVSKIHKGLNVKLPLGEIFKMPTIKQISKYMESLAREKYVSMKPLEKKEYYAVSSAQKRLFILEGIEDLNTTYNLPLVIIGQGALDKGHFEKAFQALIKRHESLRTSFRWKGEEPVQIIHQEIEFQIHHREVDTTGAETEPELRKIVESSIKSFDLSMAPLIRVNLLKLSEEKHLFIYDMHHIISDGVSMSLLARDFFRLYEGEKLPGLMIQYKDFSHWQNQWFASAAMKNQEAYWLEQMKGEIPVLKMPLDNPRPTIRSFTGDKITFNLDRQLTGKIKEILSLTNTTLYMALLAVYTILLNKYTEQEDIIVGIPTAGRNHVDIEHVVGFFVNTLAIRSYPNGDKTYREFLAEVKMLALEAYENQDYPFDELVDQLNISRKTSRNPLLDVLFVSENVDIPGLEVKGLNFSPYDYQNKTSHLDLALYMGVGEDNINMILEYSTTLFKKSTARQMTKHYVEIVRQVAENTDLKLKDIKISHHLTAAKSKMQHHDLGEFGF